MHTTDDPAAHRSSRTAHRSGMLVVAVVLCCGLLAGASPAGAQGVGRTGSGGEPIEDMVVIVRAVTALLAIALAMALVVVLTPGSHDDE